MQLNTKPNAKIHTLRRTEQQSYSRMVLTLLSGTQYAVSEIKLFDSQSLAKAQALKAKGMQKMGGWSSGIGFWGSFDWVLTGSLMLGVVEEAVSKVVIQEGTSLLAQAQSGFDTARREGRYLLVSQIANIDLGMPQLWRAFVPQEGTYIHNSEPVVAIKTVENAEVIVVWDKVEQLWVE